MDIVSWFKDLFGASDDQKRESLAQGAYSGGDAKSTESVDLASIAGLNPMIAEHSARYDRERAEAEAAKARSPGAIAKKAIDLGEAAAGMTVTASLSWKGETVAPRLPAGLTCHALDLTGTAIEELPQGLTVRFRLTLRDCKQLRRLPAGLRAGTLELSGCTSLVELPEDFATSFLDISDCPQLEHWPKHATLEVGRLRARNCTRLTELPPWIKSLSQLDLRGCANISSLPDGLRVSSWIDVGGTGIRSLPPSLAGVGLRWRGVRVDERIAFRPEEITAEEVLQETNAESRRVKLERMGYERFLEAANSEVLDSDTDAGGTRTLLRVPLEDDEPLVCVSVNCPSTSRQYLIRVPPTTTTCRQAIAWTAGFENPDDYRPAVET